LEGEIFDHKKHKAVTLATNIFGLEAPLPIRFVTFVFCFVFFVVKEISASARSILAHRNQI